MKGLEMSLLKSWTDWDELDVGCLQFSNVVLRDDVGLPANLVEMSGQVGSGVGFTLDTQSSTIQVWKDDEDLVFEAKVELSLKR